MYQEIQREIVLTDEELIGVKKLSTLFGVMTVDFEREVTMFEGPIDAMFMQNSIGLATAGRSTLEFDEIPTIRYMFDNDTTGKKKMMEKKGQISITSHVPPIFVNSFVSFFVFLF